MRDAIFLFYEAMKVRMISISRAGQFTNKKQLMKNLFCFNLSEQQYDTCNIEHQRVIHLF